MAQGINMDFSEVVVGVAVSEMKLVRLVEEGLGVAGFQDVAVVDNLDAFAAVTKAAPFDLLIADYDLPGGSPCKLLQQKRMGTHGIDPFTLTIMLVAAPEPKVVRQVVDSGCDAVLVKPFDPDQLVTRISKLAESRKPFVVTFDYIGPDRRMGPPRAGSQEIEKVRVPNPLKNRITKQTDQPSALREQERALLEINAQRVERYAFQACFLIEQVIPKMESGVFDAAVRANLEKLCFIADDLLKRMPGTPRAMETHKCLSLQTMANQVKDSLPDPDPEDVRLLDKMGNVLALTFDVKISDALREKMNLRAAG